MKFKLITFGTVLFMAVMLLSPGTLDAGEGVVGTNDGQAIERMSLDICSLIENSDIEGYESLFHPKYIEYLQSTEDPSGETVLNVERKNYEMFFKEAASIKKPISCSFRKSGFECVERHFKRHKELGLTVDDCGMLEIEMMGPDRLGKKLNFVFIEINRKWYLGESYGIEYVLDAVSSDSVLLFRGMDKKGKAICKAILSADEKGLFEAFLHPTIIREYEKKEYSDEVADWNGMAQMAIQYKDNKKIENCFVKAKRKMKCSDSVKKEYERFGIDVGSCGDVLLGLSTADDVYFDSINFRMYESGGDWFLTKENISSGSRDQTEVQEEKKRLSELKDLGERICTGYKEGDLDALLSSLHPRFIGFFKDMLKKFYPDFNEDVWNEEIDKMREDAKKEKAKACDIKDVHDVGCPNDFLEMFSSTMIDFDTCGSIDYFIEGNDFKYDFQMSAYYCEGKWYWSDLAMLTSRFFTKQNEG